MKQLKRHNWNTFDTKSLVLFDKSICQVRWMSCKDGRINFICISNGDKTFDLNWPELGSVIVLTEGVDFQRQMSPDSEDKITVFEHVQKFLN